MRLVVLAVLLCVGAGVLAGVALARPSTVTIANAVLFATWSAIAFRTHVHGAPGRLCGACGASDPLTLPDGSCAACAAPLHKSGWAA